VGLNRPFLTDWFPLVIVNLNGISYPYFDIFTGKLNAFFSQNDFMPNAGKAENIRKSSKNKF
jgi:hypothetical protein